MIDVGEWTVRDNMRGEDLVVCAAKKNRRYSSYEGEISAASPNLLRDERGKHRFRAGKPNELWITDVTEFRIPAVFVNSKTDNVDFTIDEYKEGADDQDRAQVLQHGLRAGGIYAKLRKQIAFDCEQFRSAIVDIVNLNPDCYMSSVHQEDGGFAYGEQAPGESVKWLALPNMKTSDAGSEGFDAAHETTVLAETVSDACEHASMVFTANKEIMQ